MTTIKEEKQLDKAIKDFINATKTHYIVASVDGYLKDFIKSKMFYQWHIQQQIKLLEEVKKDCSIDDDGRDLFDWSIFHSKITNFKKELDIEDVVFDSSKKI